MPIAKWGLLREGWAVPLLEGCLESLLMQTLGCLPRAGVQESRVDPEREMARRHGLSARDWQEAIQGVRRHMGTEEPAASVWTPDGSDAVADGGPPPAGARRRECCGQGGSIVGEGHGGQRNGADVGASAGSAGGTLDSAGSVPSTSDSYVRVSETTCRADLMGEGTPQPRGVGLQCSWGDAYVWAGPSVSRGASVRCAAHLLEV